MKGVLTRSGDFLRKMVLCPNLISGAVALPQKTSGCWEFEKFRLTMFGIAALTVLHISSEKRFKRLCHRATLRHARTHHPRHILA